MLRVVEHEDGARSIFDGSDYQRFEADEVELAGMDRGPQDLDEFLLQQRAAQDQAEGDTTFASLNRRLLAKCPRLTCWASRRPIVIRRAGRAPRARVHASRFTRADADSGGDGPSSEPPPHRGRP